MASSKRADAKFLMRCPLRWVHGEARRSKVDTITLRLESSSKFHFDAIVHAKSSC